MSISVSPYNPVQQSGCRAKNPPDLVIATRAPNSTDFGYFLGTLWVNQGLSGGYYGTINQTFTSPGVGTGTWVNFGTAAAGAIATINGISPDGSGNFGLIGTANQITITGGVNLDTFSLPAVLIAPGSIASTTTLTAGTGLTVTTGNLLVSTGNITATVGNLVATAGNLTIGGNGSIAGTFSVTGLITLGAVTQVGTLSLNATGSATTIIGGSSGAFTLVAGAGNLSINGAGNTINVGTDAAANTVVVGSTTASASLTLQSGSGGNTLISGNAAATITIGNAAQTGAINIGNSSSTGAVNIATGTGAQTISIATGGTGIKTVNLATGAIGNVVTIGTVTGAASLSLLFGTGNCSIAGAVSSTITIGNAAQTGKISIADSTAAMPAVDLMNGVAGGAQVLNIASGTSSTGAQTVNLLSGATPGANTTLNIMGGAATAGTQTFNLLASGATRAGAVNIGTGAAAHVLTLGQVTSSLAVNCPQTNTLASGSATGLTVDTSAGTGVASSFKSSGATVDAIQLVAGGIKTAATSVGAGASPQTCNDRFGSVVFSGVSIAGGATQSIVVTNSLITSNSQVALVSIVGATTGSALTIQSVTMNGAGHTMTIVVMNGTGLTTTTANITVTYWLLT